MGVQFRSGPWAVLVLAVAGGFSTCGAGAQLLTGSLTGQLTDTHSLPLENVTLTLRNAATGAAVGSITSRGGRYAFKDLAEGEYTLAASGPLGRGEVGGIVVSAGHESRVRAAIEFAAASAVRADTISHRPAEGRVDAEKVLPAPIANNLAPEPGSAVIEASVAGEPMLALPLTAWRERTNHVAPESMAVPVALFALAGVAELENVDLQTLPESALVRRATSMPLAAAAVEKDFVQPSSEAIQSVELEALPLVTQDWSGLLADAHGSADAQDDVRGPRPFERNHELSIDGMRTGSRFGGMRRGRGGEFFSGESAIHEVQLDRTGALLGVGGTHGRVAIATRQGTEHLHGQLSVFDRQHVLGAQNPFTQWVKEAAPGSGSAVPTFTGAPYTPANLELRWGVGIGGAIRRRHLFWFGALDGYERNHPAVATVRHPDRFFAQPSNDQMQLLSAQLGLSSVDPISEGVNAYSKLLESLAGLLGPAPRSSHQLSGFGRLDWSVGDRHRFTLEGNGSERESAGGGSTRASEMYGSHSVGSVNSENDWVLGRWQAFATSNLLAVTRGSLGRDVQMAEPERPSTFEQSLNVNAWGQLPEIVVDSRDGFTIGNPARFGRGRYPDENTYSAQQQLKWVHGKLLLDVGGELSHKRDATSRLRNQTGTYHYSSVEDFASDALSFFAFGLNGQLNPMEQHNCDQRGRPWRDAAGVLHGLGYLPCYSYYSQTMGPSEWWVSTNDWAGYATSQWRLKKRAVFTVAMRWEVEQLPGPIEKLNNPDLPIAGRLPGLGSQWGPRAGLAWGAGESRWPVIRLGYGMYFSRTPNAVIESALTQTGSPNGNLNFFMRPTDNLHGGGAPPFPYVLAGEPGTAVKPGAVEFAPSFRNGEVQQAEVSVEEMLPGRIHLEASGVASLGRRLPVTVDANIDPSANPKTITYAVVDGNGSGPIKTPQITVPFFASWPSSSSGTGFGGRLNSNYQQVSEIFSRANSTYEALLVRVSRNARGLAFRGRYTLGHAADWNPDEGPQISGPSVLDPIDLRQEYGASDLDVRHSATATMILQPRWKLSRAAGYLANGWMLSGVGQFHSGLPYTMRTSGALVKEFNVSGQAIVGLSTGMNGYGGDNRVYGVGRNTYRYPSTWKADLRIAKRFNLGEMRQLELMAESFNLFNHQNVTQVETVGYFIEQGTANGAMPRLSFLTGLKSEQTEFGKPLDINATDLFGQRQVQFGARMRF
jgi:hypothetical protein